MLKYLAAGLFLFSSLFGRDLSWVQKQIEEDFTPIPQHSIATDDLYSAFLKIGSQDGQALYCRIYNNRVHWEATPRKDNWRNPHIFRYFETLAWNYRLPDVEFILMTGDGCEGLSTTPIFTFSRYGPGRNVFLFPDFEMLWEIMDPNKNWLSQCNTFSATHPWETKKAQAFFRGASTGFYNPSLPDFGNDRVRAVLFSASHPDLLDATFSVVFQDPIKDLLTAINKPLASATIDEHFPYKYLLDIDGNASTYSRGRWILLSNSTLCKVMSPFSQWYYKAMIPWVHYVPVSQDLSDLEMILHMLKQNDDLAHAIAENGQALGQEIFTKEVLDHYVISLLFTYADKIKR